MTKTALVASVDLYNLFNADAVLGESNIYSNWRTPQIVMGARLLKFTLNMNF